MHRDNTVEMVRPSGNLNTGWNANATELGELRKRGRFDMEREEGGVSV